MECFGPVNNCLATTNKTALKAMTQNLRGLEWFGSKKDCWDVFNNIIAFKAMAQNMTADDWFLPRLLWIGMAPREKNMALTAEEWVCSIDHCLEE